MDLLEALLELDESKKDDKEVANKLRGLKNIEFYRTESNDCPVAEFIFNSISDAKLRAKIARDMEVLEEKREQLTMPEVEYIADGIYCLRTIQSNNITRIFYFFTLGNLIVMTNGYVKKTPKMSDPEFKLAKKYMDDYLRRRINK